MRLETEEICNLLGLTVTNQRVLLQVKATAAALGMLSPPEMSPDQLEADARLVMAISVHVQMSPGCGHGQQTLALVRDVLSELAPDASVEVVEVGTIEDTERLGFRGSPTVLVDGVDIEPHPPAGVGLG